MSLLSYLIPFIGAFLGWGLALIATRYFAGALQKLDVSSDVNPLLDHHLEALVVSVKQQIPMVGMFFSESISGKLKGQAKGEILQMIPQLKQKLIERCLLRHLATIKWVGAGCGFVLGVVQLVIIWFCGSL